MKYFGLNKKIYKNPLLAPPEITQNDVKDKHAYESTPISFAVTATGIPKPEAQWLHNGKPIIADNRVKIVEEGDKYKLVITDVQLGDQGEYSVIVKNQLAQKIQNGVLSVTREFFFFFFRAKLIDEKTNRQLLLNFVSLSLRNLWKTPNHQRIVSYRLI